MKNTKLYKEKINTADRMIYEVMSSDDTTKTISEIRKTYNLRVSGYDKNLAYIVGEVLLGITHPKDFVSELKTNLFVSQKIAVLIAKKINQDIFKPVKHLLIKIHKIGGNAQEATNSLPKDTNKIKNIEPTHTTFSPKIPVPPKPPSY